MDGCECVQVYPFTVSDFLHLVFINVSNLFLYFLTFIFNLSFVFSFVSPSLIFHLSATLYLYVSIYFSTESFVSPEMVFLFLSFWSLFHFILATNNKTSLPKQNNEYLYFFFFSVPLPLPQQFDFKLNFQLFFT